MPAVVLYLISTETKNRIGNHGQAQIAPPLGEGLVRYNAAGDQNISLKGIGSLNSVVLGAVYCRLLDWSDIRTPQYHRKCLGAWECHQSRHQLG